MSEIVQGDRWMVLYEDGSTFCSADGSPWEAPRTGVQIIAQSKDQKDSDWYQINQFDNYYYEEDRGGWCEARDMMTVMLHLQRAKYPCVIFGSMLSNRVWAALHKSAKAYIVRHREWFIGVSNERPPQNYL